MCFEKNSKRRTAKQNMYVVKRGILINSESLTPNYSGTSLVYRKDVLFQKGIKDQIKAFFNKALNGEVFHCYNVPSSIYRLSNFFSESEYGLFEIPKGTVYYENIVDNEIATFAIRYLGPLTHDNKNRVLTQLK